MSQDLPVLKEVAQSTWRKENELKELKSDLAALDRKIQISLKPIDQGEDKKESQTADIPTNKRKWGIPSGLL